MNTKGAETSRTNYSQAIRESMQGWATQDLERQSILRQIQLKKSIRDQDLSSLSCWANRGALFAQVNPNMKISTGGVDNLMGAFQK